MAHVFHQPDPRAALTEYIRIFGRLWEADRALTRHLRGLAALDSDFAQVIHARDERRRLGVGVLLQRFADALPHDIERDELVNILVTLLSFETFDALAGPERAIETVTPVVTRLVFAVLRLEPV